ncbi:hypothetical protein HC928_01775 [bacterium]|nr:hypothetical protein [bacterium]
MNTELAYVQQLSVFSITFCLVAIIIVFVFFFNNSRAEFRNRLDVQTQEFGKETNQSGKDYTQRESGKRSLTGIWDSGSQGMYPPEPVPLLSASAPVVTIDSYAEINVLHIQDAISRHTNIQFPDQCIIAQPVPLSIQLTVEVNSLSRSSEQIIVPFQGDDAVNLWVFVSADSFDVEPRQCKMWVPVFEDSETVTFTLTPHELGEQAIEIELYNHTARIGYMVIDTIVVEAV